MKELKKRIIIYLTFLRLKALLILSDSEQRKIAKLKAHQRIEYEKLKNKFLVHYNNTQHMNIDRYVAKLWNDYNDKLSKKFLPYPEFFFLQNPIVTRTMFVTRGGEWLKHELNFLKNKLNKNLLSRVLMEDYVGGALLSNKEYKTSYNSIHHLYHFIHFFDQTKVDMESINTVIEWGGGYGNAAKIFKRLKSKPLTYVLIDIPLLSCLQWIYLSAVFGEDEVNFIDSPKNKIEKNKINILPVSFIDKYRIEGDLFISTWALSESSRYSQSYVSKNNWFSCPHVLLGFQGKNYWLPDAGGMRELAETSGCIIEDIGLMKDNYYAFK